MFRLQFLAICRKILVWLFFSKQAAHIDKKATAPGKWSRTEAETCRSNNLQIKTLCNRLVLIFVYLVGQRVQVAAVTMNGPCHWTSTPSSSRQVSVTGELDQKLQYVDNFK
jgi:hypothetical protein